MWGSFLPWSLAGALLLSAAGFFYGEHVGSQHCAAAAAVSTAKAIALAKDDQAKRDKITLDSAVKEAQAQHIIETRTVTLTKEIPVHVKELTACVPLGLVRVLDAAAIPGTDPNANAPGQPDDSCAGISWRAFAADLIDDYGIGQSNAEQLNALIAWNKAQAHP